MFVIAFLCISDHLEQFCEFLYYGNPHWNDIYAIYIYNYITPAHMTHQPYVIYAVTYVDYIWL